MPLLTTRSTVCPDCDGTRRRKHCQACGHTGYERINLEGAWGPCHAFLVCGGPSLGMVDTQELSRPGVMSLGVNNAAAAAPVKAWTFSDGQEKFHHSLYLDPSVMTFCPTAKLGKHLRVRLPTGEFRFTERLIRDCPNTYGYSRRGWFHPDVFLTSWAAHWGMGGRQDIEEPYRSLCTLDDDGKYQRPYTCLCTALLGLRLLCHLGAKRIFLIGVDFWRESKEKGYGFDEVGSGGDSYTKERRMFSELAPALKAAGIEVYNASPISTLKAFPFCSWREAVDSCVVEKPKTLRGWYGSKGRLEARDYHKEHGFVSLSSTHPIPCPGEA